jgi:hypothetical protein
MARSRQCYHGNGLPAVSDLKGLYIQRVDQWCPPPETGVFCNVTLVSPRLLADVCDVM